ncbi:MAG: hypothetical protein KDJ97_15495, partial [Anaerolineae bacterium]|nr:hypothetical protein [Anaerolineae bacterium]
FNFPAQLLAFLSEVAWLDTSRSEVYELVHRLPLMVTDFYLNFDDICDHLCLPADLCRLLKQSLTD